LFHKVVCCYHKYIIRLPATLYRSHTKLILLNVSIYNTTTSKYFLILEKITLVRNSFFYEKNACRRRQKFLPRRKNLHLDEKINGHNFYHWKKITLIRKKFFHEKMLVVDDKNSFHVRNPLYLDEKIIAHNFSHWKKLLCYEYLFFVKKRLPSTSKNSLLNYVVGLFTIK